MYKVVFMFNIICYTNKCLSKTLQSRCDKCTSYFFTILCIMCTIGYLYNILINTLMRIKHILGLFNINSFTEQQNSVLIFTTTILLFCNIHLLFCSMQDFLALSCVNYNVLLLVFQIILICVKMFCYSMYNVGMLYIYNIIYASVFTHIYLLKNHIKCHYLILVYTYYIKDEQK